MVPHHSRGRRQIDVAVCRMDVRRGAPSGGNGMLSGVMLTVKWWIHTSLKLGTRRTSALRTRPPPVVHGTSANGGGVHMSKDEGDGVERRER